MTPRSCSGQRPIACATLSICVRVDRLAVAVVGEHVGEPDDRGLARRRPRSGGARSPWRAGSEAPSGGPGRRRPAVVDAELAALAVDALLGRARIAVDVLRVAGVGVHEHELADVVQQGGAEQLVAIVVVDLAREPVGGALRGDGVQAEALRHQVPDGGALEEVEGGGAGGERLDALRA